MLNQKPPQDPGPSELAARTVMSQVDERLEKFAPVDRPVLLLGPVGVGKTTAARRLHAASGRKGQLVPLSAAEVSEALYRDTLFGHVRGAFTGATSRRAGALERASRGTLLFDDLVFLPLSAQVALLRVLDSGRYMRVGEDRDSTVACRVVFASTLSLNDLVERGQLIPDLRSRIGEFVIEVPALRDRADDIPKLVRLFAERFADAQGFEKEVDFSFDAMAALVRYPWPDNLRELDNVVAFAVVMAETDAPVTLVEVHHLPPRLREVTQGGRMTPALARWAVARTGGNQSEAALRLKAHRNTISNHLKKGTRE